MKIDLSQSLCGALGACAGDVVAIAGAGGKTSLMYGLGRELAAAGERVLLTTTTKIVYPKGQEVALVLFGPENRATLEAVKSRLDGRGPVLAGREKQEGKVIGFSPRFAAALHAHASPVTLVAECDGAMGKSLKVPRGWEPLLPSTTAVYVVVIGADCLGRPLDSGLVFQPEAVAAIAGVKGDAPVDTTVAVRSVVGPESYAGRKPDGARLCVFINKWTGAYRGRSGGSDAQGRDPAMDLALALRKTAVVDRVVLGSLKDQGAAPLMVIG